jgi:hypothetical protein
MITWPTCETTVDKMTTWWNDYLMKYPSIKWLLNAIATRLNEHLMKEMTICWNDKWMKWQFYEMKSEWNDIRDKMTN